MSTHDQTFFNLFMVVIGILIGITVFLIVLARYVASDTQLAWVRSDPAWEAAVNERIAPFGRAALPGDPGATVVPAVVTAAPVAAKLTGEQVYNTACFACHGSGVGGAPKFGDRDAWRPRIGQGRATLERHSLEGFQGQAGYMPPKGGRVDLSDEEIIAALDFMVKGSG